LGVVITVAPPLQVIPTQLVSCSKCDAASVGRPATLPGVRRLPTRTPWPGRGT